MRRRRAEGEGWTVGGGEEKCGEEKCASIRGMMCGEEKGEDREGDRV